MRAHEMQSEQYAGQLLPIGIPRFFCQELCGRTAKLARHGQLGGCRLMRRKMGIARHVAGRTTGGCGFTRLSEPQHKCMEHPSAVVGGCQVAMAVRCALFFWPSCRMVRSPKRPNALVHSARVCIMARRWAVVAKVALASGACTIEVSNSMVLQAASVEALRRSTIEDVYTILGWAPDNLLRWLFLPLIWPGSHLFARGCSRFDNEVAQTGIAEAMSRMLPRFARKVQLNGAERIPREGALIVLANHPGTFDSMLLAATIRRDDLQVIAWEWPLLRRLSATSRHIIFASEDPHQRMGVVRTAISRLKAGDALLVYPTSDLDPDPDVQPGSKDALQRWSPSIELFLRQVPGAQVVVAIVSGVVAPNLLRHPLARLPKSAKRQRSVAELLQMLAHLAFPWTLALVPRLSFSSPLTLEELNGRNGPSGIHRAITDVAESLLASHMQHLPHREHESPAQEEITHHGH